MAGRYIQRVTSKISQNEFYANVQQVWSRPCPARANHDGPDRAELIFAKGCCTVARVRLVGGGASCSVYSNGNNCITTLSSLIETFRDLGTQKVLHGWFSFIHHQSERVVNDWLRL